MEIHSVDDPIARYHGGLGSAAAGAGTRIFHPDVEEVIGRWASRDGCAPAPHVAERQAAANGDTATHLVWSPCAGGVEVGLWRLTGAGHVWPGAPANLPRILGADTTVLDANREIWRFVSRFRLRDAAAGSAAK
jgi:polyhydroxybutyrate depolymerase